MTKLRLLALLAVVALVLFPAIAFAQGGLEPPCAFHGTVQVNGQNVADGTVITAKIGNDTYTTTTGNSIYRVVIAQPEAKSYSGMAVSFMIGNATVTQTATWQIGGNVLVNLTRGVAPPIEGGGGITQVVVNALAAGSAPTVSYNPDTGILTLGIPAGQTGATGATGAIGAAGPAGKAGSSVLGIVGIVLAVIAIALAVIVMMRKPRPAPPPPPKP
jgi:uncharacterized protein YdeI (BOF family)